MGRRKKRKGALGWLRRHPLLAISTCVACWCAWRLGSPGWASVGLLPAPAWYGASLGWRKVNPTSKLHALPTSVYGYRGANGEFVYIGITVTGRETTRWAEHADKWWSPQAVGPPVVLARYPDRYKALTREALLIRRHRPIGNTMHNRVQGWRVLLSAKYLLRLGEYRDPRRRRDALETAAVISWRYRTELWLYETTRNAHRTRTTKRKKVTW